MHFRHPLFASARVIKATERLTARAGAETRQAIRLTPSAVARVKELIAKRQDVRALKIGVQQRGCNGLTYTLDYAQQREKFDEEVSQDGALIWIDSKAQLTLIGSEMDFVQSKLAAEFVFHNPNIKGTCGCGESFNIDTPSTTALPDSSPTSQYESINSENTAEFNSCLSSPHHVFKLRDLDES